MLTILFLAIAIYRLPIFLVELQWKWQPVFRIQRRPETTEVSSVFNEIPTIVSPIRFQLMSPYRVALYSVVDPFLSNFFPFALMCVSSLLTLCEIVKSRHFAYAQFSIDSQSSAGGAGGSLKRSSCSSSQPLSASTLAVLRVKRAEGVRQKQGKCLRASKII